MGPRTARAATIAAVVAASLVGASHAGASTRLIHIYFYGDSLTVQEANYIYPQFNSLTTSVRVNAISGTALCDYVYPRYHAPTGRFTPGAIMQLTAATAPSVAVIQFYGNVFTGCIKPDAGSVSTLVANYTTMLRAAVTHLLAIGTRYVIVDRGPPGKPGPSTSSPIGTALVTGYRSVITSFHNSRVVYNAAADASVLNHGAYASTLPCLSSEVANSVCTGPVVAGVGATNQARASDGVHFCPGAPPAAGAQVSSVCTVWASGAMRFAAAFARAIWGDIAATRPVGPQPYVNSVSPSSGPAIGGTTITVTGHSLAGVTSVAIVKYFNPVLGGAALSASVPTRVFVPCTEVRVLSSTKLTALAPALDALGGPDPLNEYVVVYTPSGQSVTGLASQAFSEP